MAPSLRRITRRLAVTGGFCLLALAVLTACNYLPRTPLPAGPSPLPSPLSGGQIPTRPPDNVVMCTPPPCAAGEAYYCPGDCPGGCGTTCATRTPALTPSPTPRNVVQCTPPPCQAGETYYCPGNCPGGCGTTCATRTPGPSGAPEIEFFRALPAEADPGDTVTLEWASRGGSRGAMYHLLGGQLSEFWDVAATGHMTYTIPATMRNNDSLMLFVLDDAGQEASAVLVITLRCPDTWFFTPPPGECSSGPAMAGLAAEQPFEHGTMVWLEREDRIYVLFSDGLQPAWVSHADEWREGDPPSDPGIVPPAGLLQPVRGFGLVWRTQPNVRDRLGWATAVEASYAGAVQRTGRFKYNLTYLRALDGGVWELGPEGSAWRHLP